MIRRHWPFFLSCLLAFSSGHMVNYSVILYMQEVVRSDLLSGIGFGLCFGPPLVFGWYAGALCDRLAPGRLIHAAQAVFVLALLCLVWADGGAAAARVPWVLTAAGLAGVAWSFVAPARMATLAQIVAPAMLKPATILFNLLVMLGFGLGPLLIGVLRNLAGWGGVFSGAIAGFGLASLLLLSVRTTGSDRPHQSVAADIREGIAAVAAAPLLRQLLLAAVIAYAMMGPLQILLPKLARNQLGLNEIQRGAYLGLLAAALIVGGVVCLATVRRLHHGRTILFAIGSAGLLFASLGAIGSTPLSAAVLTAIGIAGGMVVSLIVAGIQANAALATRGRVLSMYTIASQVIPAASGICAGVLVKFLDVAGAAYAVGIALTLAAALAALLMPGLRGYRG